METKEVESCTTELPSFSLRLLNHGSRRTACGDTHFELGQVQNVLVTVAAAVLVVPSVGDVVAQVVQVHLDGREAEREVTV